MADKPRRARLDITYKSEDVSRKISEYVTDFTYMDVAGGQSDSIDITLADIDEEWITSARPLKGDTIAASIRPENWKKDGDRNTFRCGTFTIDDISFSGRPLVCNIGAVSTPVNTDFKSTQRTKMWTKATIKEIAGQIAKEAGVKLVYEAGTIDIAELEQDRTSNSEFLSGLCSDYGLAMKIYSDRIIIYDEEEYEKKKRVRTIKENEMLSWSYNTTLDGTYTGARVSYTNPDTRKTITLEMGEKTRVMELNIKVDGRHDAELKAAARVNSENKKITTMSVKIMADTSITAGSVVGISGLGRLNGDYFVDSVTHSLGRGYTMTLSLRAIQDRIKAESKKYAEKSAEKNTGSTGKGGQTPLTASVRAGGTEQPYRPAFNDIIFMGVAVENGIYPKEVNEMRKQQDRDFINKTYGTASPVTEKKVFRNVLN